MPEGELTQFDPSEPIDKPVEPSTGAEPSLEQLKDPKYWEQEFQKQWEAKAGREKNWSGLRVLNKLIPDNMDGVVAILPNGEIICYKEHSGFYSMRFDDNLKNQRRAELIRSRDFNKPINQIIQKLRSNCQSSSKLSDGVRIVIVHAGQTETYLRVDDPQEHGHHHIPDPIEYQDEWNKYRSLVIENS